VYFGNASQRILGCSFTSTWSWQWRRQKLSWHVFICGHLFLHYAVLLSFLCAGLRTRCWDFRLSYIQRHFSLVSKYTCSGTCYCFPVMTS